MMIGKLIAAATLAGFIIPALAQTASTPRVDKRQASQERRLQQGEKSGALTDREAARLERGQARVRKMEDRAVADGKVTKKERARLEHAQNRQSRKIFREKHDRQTAK